MTAANEARWELGRLVRPTLQLNGCRISTFHACGACGFVLAAAATLILAARNELSVPVMTLLIMAAVAVLLGLVLVTKLITGEEKIVNYHHQIAVAVVSFALLIGLDRPPLPYLDLMTLGVGLFVAFGRLGCFHAGCCHGVPQRWGVRYSPNQAAQLAVPTPYLGVALFPTQLVEALFVGAAALFGLHLVARGAPPGMPAVIYGTAYAFTRFFVETKRGDVGRPTWAGMSGAQWTSVLVLAVLLVLSAWGGLPSFEGQSAVATAAGAAALTLVGRRALFGPVVSPGEAIEAAALMSRRPPTAAIHLVELPSGVRLSSSRVAVSTGDVSIYGVSHRQRRLRRLEARSWARSLGRLHGASRVRPVAASNGVHRFLAPTGANAPSAKPANTTAVADPAHAV